MHYVPMSEKDLFAADLEKMRKDEFPGVFVDDVTGKIEKIDEDAFFVSDRAAALHLALRGYNVKEREGSYYLVKP
jgi:hypothetical protein